MGLILEEWWDVGFLKILFLFTFLFFGFFFFLCSFCGLFRATLAAYGGSQAKGPIRAITSCLHHSHSNAGYKPHLWPTPQLRQCLILKPLSEARG